MGSGFELNSGVSDVDTPTWCLEAEKKDLEAIEGALNEVDAKRLESLRTLISSRKIIET